MNFEKGKMMGLRNLIALSFFLAVPLIWPADLEETSAQIIIQGNQFYDGKDYAKAAEFYENAIKLDPNSAAAYQGLGNAYYRLGRKQEAIVVYEKSLLLNPRNVQLVSFVKSIKAQEVEGSSISASGTQISVVTGSNQEVFIASKGHFIWGIGLGGVIPVNGFSNLYSAGFGLDTSFGYAVSDNFSFLLSVDGSLFSTTLPGVYSTEINFAPSMKYSVGDSREKVYGIIGLGLNENIATEGNISVNQDNLMIEGGAGIQFPEDDRNDFYIQAKFSEIFAPYNFYYIPITMGIIFN